MADYFLSLPASLILWGKKAVFGTFFASAIICLGMSSMFHTPKVFYFMFVRVLGAASATVSMGDKFREPPLRCVRAGVFAGFSGVIPAVYYLIVFSKLSNMPLLDGCV
ncbi:putative adiponectin receptor protein [Nephila pilipes]|uniref:Putative adiponectin receptor protein n=1 Tax=Nephila pilipes TaxID=299642 RepID=A0A8X6PKQ6_NEPPI|nr:putative adiponectin receptor protein [Nephila pilipes]